MGPTVLHRIAAILRTRLAGAVVMPLVLAGAWAYSRGGFALPAFLLVLAGLLAAEFMSLILADLVASGRIKVARADPAPELPGSPVSRAIVQDPRRAGLALAGLAACGMGVFAYFLASAGPGILAPFGIALICAFLYAFQPFRGAYLATAAVPVVISGGAYFVMAGTWDPGAFLAGAPVSLVSIGVILTYRVAYRQGRLVRGGRNAVMASYLCSICAIPGLGVLGIYGRYSPAAILPALALAAYAWLKFSREAGDPVPATSAGVLLHAALSFSLALSLLF
jgi:hypothetical protein